MANGPNPGSGRGEALGAGATPGGGSTQVNNKAGAPNVQSQQNSPCLISFPSASVPLVGSVGGGCLLSKTNVRAMVGGLLLGVGGLVFIAGVAVLAASAFRKSGALDKTAGAIGSVPLPQAQVAAAGLRAAGRPRSGPSRRERAAASERALERKVGEPRQNDNLRTGKGAVRETPAGTRRRARERDEPPF